MDPELVREYCLAKRGVTEGFPFDESTLVFKVGDKMFCLMALERVPLSINLKCDPERAEELRAAHEAVEPGYHMNKKHWNTVVLEGDLSTEDICELIDHSYELVIGSLTKKKRRELGLDLV
jgi:predicted DNA-binding protein (MmcQ/YjbR family)